MRHKKKHFFCFKIKTIQLYFYLFHVRVKRPPLEVNAMSWFNPAEQRLNTLLLQGLGTPNTENFKKRLNKIIKLIGKPGLLHSKHGETWLSITLTSDLPMMIQSLPNKALTSFENQTLLHECPQNAQEFERWWVALRSLPAELLSLPDQKGYTPLHLCTSFSMSSGQEELAHSHIKRAQALIEAGANLFALEGHGRTPLETWMLKLLDVAHCPETTWNSFKPLVQSLVQQHGFKRLMPSFWKEHYLHALIGNQNHFEPGMGEKIGRLIEAGYPVNRTRRGTGILHLVATHKLAHLAGILVNQGARSKIKNKEGLTPMDILRKKHPGEIGESEWIVLEHDHLQEVLPHAKGQTPLRRL